MELILKCLLFITAVQFAIELYNVFVGLENHEYIGGSYQHSIQHFAYLSLYFIGTVLFMFDTHIQYAIVFVLFGTLILNFHIRGERMGKF